MSIFSEAELRAQQDDIDREKAIRHERQVARWKAESMSLMSPSHKFLMLLAEGYRHEVATIRNGNASRPLHVSDTEALTRDVTASYTCLVKEAKRLFSERIARRVSIDEVNAVAEQATGSFASLYPWSDGITCRDLSVGHRHFMPLASQRMITAGESGIVTMRTFVATFPIAEAKQEAAVELRQQRMDEYNCARTDNAADMQQETGGEGPHTPLLAASDSAEDCSCNKADGLIHADISATNGAMTRAKQLRDALPRQTAKRCTRGHTHHRGSRGRRPHAQ